MDTLLKRYRQRLLKWITRSTLTMSIAAASCLSSGLATAESTFPVSAHLKKVEGRVVAAWVIVIYPPAFYLTNLTEDGLKQRGCNYIVNRKPELSMLMAILQRGDIGDRGEFRRQWIDPRIAIYLQLADGGQEQLLFEEPDALTNPALDSTWRHSCARTILYFFPSCANGPHH